jgi:CHAT domain-containing protein
MRAAALAVAAGVVSGLFAAAAAAAPTAALEDDPAREPYLLSLGPRDLAQRSAALVRLADASTRAGHQARAARYLAMACYSESVLRVDVSLAATNCRRARALAERLDLLDVRVSLAASRGNLQAWTLDVAGAVATLQAAIADGAALDVNTDLGMPLRWAHFDLGAVLLEAGKYDLGIAELTAMRDASARARDPIVAAWSELWLCRGYARLGDPATARARCAAVRRYVEASRDWAMALNLAWIEGMVEDMAGRPAAALDRFEEAWRLSAPAGGALLRPALMVELTSTLLALGRIDDAAVWQQRHEAALPALPPAYAPQAWLLGGDLARARGDRTGAAAAYQRATASPVHSVAIRARTALAAVRRELGDHAGARAALEDAIARIEADRDAVVLDQRASFMALHGLAYRELVGTLWDLEAGRSAPAALAVAERGRARALLDAMTVTGAPGAAAAVLELPAIQAWLAPDQLLIEYVVTPDRTFAIGVSVDDVVLVPLPGAGGEPALAQRVTFFRQLVAESPDAAPLVPAARRLYDDLVAPILAALPGTPRELRTLIVSPDGALHALPWDALADEQGRFAVDRWRIAVVPSGSLAARPLAEAPAPPAGVLVVAIPQPVGGLPSLPAAVAERGAIERRLAGDVTALVGEAATEAAIAAAAPRAAVVHVAGHATIDRTMPLRSALLVAAGDGADGRWRAEEIYRLPLRADLVVLSACETGVGVEVYGEGVESLSRAFLHAGASSTIATLWPVSDAIGPAFADTLYRRLGARAPILTAATDAKRALRAGGARPADWAAYVVTAPPAAVAWIRGRDLPGRGGSARWRWWLGGLAALGGLGLALRRPRLGVTLATVTVAGVVLWPGRDAPPPGGGGGGLQLASSAPRGGDPGVVAASLAIAGGAVRWQARPDRTYTASFLDGDGRPLGPPAAASGGELPIPEPARWVMIEVARDEVADGPPTVRRVQ